VSPTAGNNINQHLLSAIKELLLLPKID